MWSGEPATPAFTWLRQEDEEFKASMGCTLHTRLKRLHENIVNDGTFRRLNLYHSLQKSVVTYLDWILFLIVSDSESELVKAQGKEMQI